jgi:hypothetical protein
MNKLLLIIVAAALISSCNRGPDPCTPSSLAVIAREDGIDRVLSELRDICEYHQQASACQQARTNIRPILSCYYYLTE